LQGTGHIVDATLMMRRFIDLHVHSARSDGSSSPAEIIALADARRLAAVALTDHDTVAGVAEARQAAGSFPELAFVAGVEISARYRDRGVHIVGLGIDEKNSQLLAGLDKLLAARRERNPLMIARLNELGLDITMEDVLAAAMRRQGREGSGRNQQPPEVVISRLHIAEALVARGHCKSTQDAFDRYVGAGLPGYVEKDRMAPAEAIDLIRGAGGLAVLAHPVHLGCENLAQLELVVRELRSAGLDAIEIYHPDQSPTQTRQYLSVARRLGLATTGGSDFHGRCGPEATLGRPPIPLSVLEPSLRHRLLGKA
jgi:predicted metal-dependent phosphoesterase TrpH